MTQAEALELFEYKDGQLYKKHNGKRVGWPGNSQGYISLCVNRRSYLAHRLIFLMHHGYMPTQIDHINNNNQDNHIENLRECTYSVNNFSRPKFRNNSSGAVGVRWHKMSGRWVAQIGYGNKHLHLGSFENKTDAIKARLKAEAELFKEHSHGNRKHLIEDGGGK